MEVPAERPLERPTAEPWSEPRLPDTQPQEPSAEPIPPEIAEPPPSNDSGVEIVPEPTAEARPDLSNHPCPATPLRVPFGGDTVTLACSTQASGLREYTLETTHPLRDNDPPSRQIRFSEIPSAPLLRTGNLLTDSLFALALEEIRQNSVSSVAEGSFNQGKPVPCACFQTGAKWTWAWTRDTAYAVDLALAWLDPQRSEDTLRFKLSSPKPSASSIGDPQIVQDTGSGGSWPVSSDRVIWALAARKLSWLLPSNRRTSFLLSIYPALVQTARQDRLILFDPDDGLYRGEQSFLDWREQSYPAWCREDLAHIAMSKALSTNLAHLILLDWIARLASDLQKPSDASTFSAWASSLKTAIHKELYRPSDGLHSTFKTTLLDPTTVPKFDLLGQALAVLEGIASPADDAKALASYPVAPFGPPVLWPQQPLIPIYHNRAIWPFVTAYWLLAARKADHPESAAHSFLSLLRGAALNLSHMENLEWITGKNYVEDGPYSGPVVNSRRQLWSVAGFLAAIVGTFFGLEHQPDQIRFQPFIPASLHRDAWLASPLRLSFFPFQGKTFDIVLHLPPSPGQSGAYTLDRIALQGSPLPDPKAWLSASSIPDRATFELWLRDDKQPPKPLTLVRDTGDFRLLWSPREPILHSLQAQGSALALQIDPAGETGILVDIFRDGQKVATQVSPGLWVDPSAKPDGDIGYCYTAESLFPSSQTRSQHSKPLCWKGPDLRREDRLDAWTFEATGGRWQDHPTAPAYSDWGGRTDALEVFAYHPRRTGRYHVDLLYRNPAGPRSTGITSSVKRLQVFEEPGSKRIATRWFVMPHTEQSPLSESTGAWLDLDAKTTYRLRLDEAPDTLHNMSFLSHFSLFSGLGGGPEPFNQTQIAAIRLFPKNAKEERPASPPLFAFDGSNDYDKFPPSQGLLVGAPLAPWERFALSWDAEWIYVAIVSQGFERDLQAYLLYIQASQGTWPPAQASQGLIYLQQTSFLPFQPSHLVGVRYKSDNNDGFGPWNGLWRKNPASWVLQQRLRPQASLWLASDRHTIAYRIHRGQLGWPDRLRISGHLVNALPSHEWKALLPPSHSPWNPSSSGFYEILLSSPPSPSSWLLR